MPAAQTRGKNRLLSLAQGQWPEEEALSGTAGYPGFPPAAQLQALHGREPRDGLDGGIPGVAWGMRITGIGGEDRRRSRRESCRGEGQSRG